MYMRDKTEDVAAPIDARHKGRQDQTTQASTRGGVGMADTELDVKPRSPGVSLRHETYDEHRRSENVLVLSQGLGVLLLNGKHFTRSEPGWGTRRESRLLRDRARSRGLRQFSRTIGSGEGVVLLVQWYLESPGDLLVAELCIPDGWGAHCMEHAPRWAAR